MFVPKATASLALSSVNSRRRQRTGSDESVKLPKAKRQRSTLRQDNLHSQNAAEEAQFTPSEYQISAELNEVNLIAADSANMEKQIVIRGPKKTEQGDVLNGTIVLSKSDFYVVSQLPGLPDQISGSQSENFRCTFGSGLGYALSLTQSHAIIWPYSTSPSSPLPADIFTLSIPDAFRDPNGAIPCGVLLSTATSGPPGLLLVVPSTGKILYWENVSSAASLGVPRQKQNGLQGSITGLLSGEYVTDLLNGEPSGIFVTFSSGRVAHVSVRDSQGKPAVMASFLGNKMNYSSGGLLGGIKNVLGGGFWRKEIAATRAGESHQRGQRDVIIATSTGLIEIWDTHWNSGSILKRQFDVKRHLSNTVNSDSTNGADVQDVVIWDVAFVANEHFHGHDSTSTGRELWPLFVAFSPSRSLNSKRFYVAQIVLSVNDIRILSTRSIDLHNIPTTPEPPKPLLLVPKTGDTAFIIIGQSVILMSLASSGEVLNYSQTQLPFQDSINFRSGKKYEILGTGVDNSNTAPYPTCLVMVRGFGVIRITALPRNRAETGIEDVKVTAKDKLEQAVFYGSMQGNPLNLVSQDNLDFPAEEIEQAALEICRQLLQSKSKFIPSTGIPLEQNLRFRAKALDDLASLLMQQSNTLSQMMWWELLWNAEKIAAQRAMWKIEEEFRSDKKRTFLSHVVGLMTDKFKTKPESREDVNDNVRHWFLYDTYRMEHIVPWIYNAIKGQKGNSSRQGQRMSEQILEASELFLSVLETAFRYRDENACRYGLGDLSFEEGVLVTGYEDLPEFWTSQNMSYIEAGNLLNLQLDRCRVWIQEVASNPEAPNSEIFRKLARNSARQVRLLSQMHRERVSWLSAQDNSRLMNESISTEQGHIKQRKWQLFKLAGIGQLGDAINLAEKFRDMSVLVELIIELQDQIKSPQKSLNIASNETEGIDRKLSHYFENFGESWADAFFTRQISMGQSGVLLAMKKYQPFVTRFLRKVPAYSRLSWINDVIGEKDYNAATKALGNMAIECESDIWCHHVELSLAKLTRLASCEKGTPVDVSFREDVRRLEDQAEIDTIQEDLYTSIAPTLQGAIDQKAEIELAVGHFGSMVSEDRPSLHEVLGDALAGVVTRQVINPDQLVDLLTLIDPVQPSNCNESELWGKEFFLALRVIQLSRHYLRDPLYNSALQKLVWRRCLIRDNWKARGEAAEVSDSGGEASLHDTALFRTLMLCSKEKHSNRSDHLTLYVPLSPSETLLHKSDTDVLVSRFRSEQQVRVAQDLERENEILGQCLVEGKLEFWFKHLLASAQSTIASPVTASITEHPSIADDV
ncbi:Nuclear pore complex [Aspergillus sclerotialis]|uniref:Nuclear pore complex n=1 Tax=Aspergillus sclerotialis TaxID=2070753 RepID=A0A3A2ZFT6_9EURO|nr:Nuclear pore complex [Aspergillus sclerotialis]